MIGSLSTEKAQQVVSPKKKKDSDLLEIDRKWREGFIVIAAMTAGTILILVDAAINKADHLFVMQQKFINSSGPELSFRAGSGQKWISTAKMS